MNEPYRRNYDDEAYSDEELLEMLRGRNVRDIFFSMKGIGRRKVKKALPELERIALYDEDFELRQEATLTVRKIGGKKGFQILRGLMANGDREFIQELLDIKDAKELELY